MKEKEFFTNDGRLYVLTQEGSMEEITEKSTAAIDDLLERIENFYPGAYGALRECYSRSLPNLPYAKFLMARRFIKCNFGELDTREKDQDMEGSFHFERVKCPMRGECKYEGTVCMPRFDSKLSKAELRVMELYYRNMEIDRIADKLYLSGHTVKNHIRNAYSKLGVHTQAEFVNYANRNHLFE